MSALQSAMDDAKAAGVRFSRTDVDGVDMFVARKGSGPPLLLLHGWPEFWMTYRPLMDRLGDRFELIAPDLRGFGDTGKARPGPDDSVTAASHADDIKRLVDALDLDTFGIVAGDVGAHVAQAFAHGHQDRLSGIFFFSTPYPGLGRRYGQPDHLIEVWYQYFQQLPWAASLVGANRDTCRIYIKNIVDHWSGDDPRVFEDWIEILVDNFMRNDNIQGGFDWYLSSAPTRRLMLEERLPKPPMISVPCRFLWGKRDPLFRTEWSDRLHEYFDDFTIDFADAGHFVHVETPGTAAEEIAAFFTPR